MDELEDILRVGLTSTPKFIPAWYRYDDAGSTYNDRCLAENKYYYFHDSEKEVITNNIHDVITCVPQPYCLVDMGSGNAEKTRILFDVILKGKSELSYLPVDISEEFLHKTASELLQEYQGRVIPRPIPGDYRKGITTLRFLPERKLILWFGSVQNLPYKTQKDYLRDLAQAMTDDDRLILTLDITQDQKQVEDAYLDPTGVNVPLFLNAFWRLNREMGADFDTNKFSLRVKFIKDESSNRPSHVDVCAVSTVDQTYHIPKLNIQISIKKEEEIRLFEGGEGVSCKYTMAQVHDLVRNGGMKLCKYWTDKDKHTVLLCLKRQSCEKCNHE